VDRNDKGSRQYVGEYRDDEWNSQDTKEIGRMLVRKGPMRDDIKMATKSSGSA
jgi:hypothetical protein